MSFFGLDDERRLPIVWLKVKSNITEHPSNPYIWQKKERGPGPGKWSWVRQPCCQEKCGRNGGTTSWRQARRGSMWLSLWVTRCARVLPKCWNSKVLTSTGRQKVWPSQLWNASRRPAGEIVKKLIYKDVFSSVISGRGCKSLISAYYVFVDHPFETHLSRSTRCFWIASFLHFAVWRRRGSQWHARDSVVCAAQWVSRTSGVGRQGTTTSSQTGLGNTISRRTWYAMQFKKLETLSRLWIRTKYGAIQADIQW